ncbi:MAG: photosystem I assembly protein Ycf4 [Aphanocapsa feldmannii 288cV]|nr:MAG: photosystem I assembly protein Ycf4 [Aphanocapsa feldmannii 288cV]
MTSPVGSSRSDESLILQPVMGSRRLSNVAMAAMVSIGATGFLLASLSSYLGRDLLPLGHPAELLFVPQGIAMGGYSVAGILVAIYLWSTIVIDVGAGENRFDRTNGEASILRRGFRRAIAVTIPLSDIQAVRVEIKEGLNPRRRLALRVRGRRDIPLTRVGAPLALTELEASGAHLASFLEVPLEGL